MGSRRKSALRIPVPDSPSEPRLHVVPPSAPATARFGRFSCAPLYRSGGLKLPIYANAARDAAAWSPLGGLGQLAAAHELLADLAHVAGGAVRSLGDHAVGHIRAASELELEQSLTPGGPAVTVRADGRLLDGLLTLAVQAEPLAALLGPALGAAWSRLAARGVAHSHLAAGAGPAAGAGRRGTLCGGCGLGHELPPRSSAAFAKAADGWKNCAKTLQMPGFHGPAEPYMLADADSPANGCFLGIRV